MAMDHLNVGPNSRSQFSAEHQAWLASMGRPSAFSFQPAPAPFPVIAPSQPVSFKVASAPSPGIGVSERSYSAPEESVGFVRSSLRIAIFGVPILIGIQSGSWLVGLIALGVAGFLGHRMEQFLETELGGLVESIVNWSLGISLLSIALIAFSSNALSGAGAIRLCLLVTLVVAAVQVAQHRLTVVHEDKEAKSYKIIDPFS